MTRVGRVFRKSLRSPGRASQFSKIALLLLSGLSGLSGCAETGLRADSPRQSGILLIRAVPPRPIAAPLFSLDGPQAQVLFHLNLHNRALQNLK